jgi:hypothetical protein
MKAVRESQSHFTRLRGRYIHYSTFVLFCPPIDLEVVSDSGYTQDLRITVCLEAIA